MSRFWVILRGVLALAALLSLAGAALVYWWRRSHERPALLVRWLITLATFLFVVFVVGPVIGGFDYVAAFLGVTMAAAAGVVMAATWTLSITEYFARKFGQLYDGGDLAIDPEPCFSMAEARRKAGRYDEAVAEVRRQLEQFPTHFRAWMLLAQIQAEDLHDLDAASASIGQLTCQPGHSPKNVAYALTQLADWHLKYRQDLDSVRALFDRIVELFPDSPEAHFAQQRIAHLPAAPPLPPSVPRVPLSLPHSEEQLGLRPDFTGFNLIPPDASRKASELAAQLERHPYDNQAREDLAVLYAEAFHRLDLATDQLEQLIAQPHAPEKQIIHWLHLLADLHVREGADLPRARQTLERILARFPHSPAADNTRRRLATLSLELRVKKESPPLSLVSAPDAMSRLASESADEPPRRMPRHGDDPAASSRRVDERTTG